MSLLGLSTLVAGRDCIEKEASRPLRAFMQGDRYDGPNWLEAFSAVVVVAAAAVLHAPLPLKAMAFDNIVVPSHARIIFGPKMILGEAKKKPRLGK